MSLESFLRSAKASGSRAKLASQPFEAILLDRDNQILATGEAIFYTNPPYGTFWPRPPIDEDLLLTRGTSVKLLPEHTLAVRNLRRCPRTNCPIHYEFDFETFAD